jgi:hypothetical protein
MFFAGRPNPKWPRTAAVPVEVRTNKRSSDFLHGTYYDGQVRLLYYVDGKQYSFWIDAEIHADSEREIRQYVDDEINRRVEYKVVYNPSDPSEAQVVERPQSP